MHRAGADQHHVGQRIDFGQSTIGGPHDDGFSTTPPQFFRDQDVAVVGGGDSAMAEATFLTRFARSVTVVHRNDQFRASKIMVDRARSNDKIRWILDTEVLEARGEQELTTMRLRDRVTGAESDLDADGYVVTAPHSSRTNVDGVFAVGDLVDHTYRQAITAAGSGCKAAIDA